MLHRAAGASPGSRASCRLYTTLVDRTMTGFLPSECTRGGVPGKAEHSSALSLRLTFDGILMPFNVSGPKSVFSAQITRCTLCLLPVCATLRALQSLIELVTPSLPLS